MNRQSLSRVRAVFPQIVHVEVTSIANYIRISRSALIPTAARTNRQNLQAMLQPGAAILRTRERDHWRIGGLIPVEKLALVEVIGNLAIDQIGKLLGARQIVDGDDVGHAPRIPRPGAADLEISMNVIQQLEQEQVAKLSAGKTIPDFEPGDTVLVNVKVTEGDRTRVQAYEGVCIARSGGGLHESFTVRKISYGEGVERVFPLYSPVVDSIKVVRRGKVRRAKLYYLRGRRGKSARIAEAQGRHGGEDVKEAAE